MTYHHFFQDWLCLTLTQYTQGVHNSAGGGLTFLRMDHVKSPLEFDSKSTPIETLLPVRTVQKQTYVELAGSTKGWDEFWLRVREAFPQAKKFILSITPIAHQVWVHSLLGAEAARIYTHAPDWVEGLVLVRVHDNHPQVHGPSELIILSELPAELMEPSDVSKARMDIFVLRGSQLWDCVSHEEIVEAMESLGANPLEIKAALRMLGVEPR